ncbi:hypothetical protein GCM10027416_03250 [Okibacterium endophyticum]
MRHPLALGWAWVLFWVAVIAVFEFIDAQDWIWFPLALACIAPSGTATVVVLKATPRTHLDVHDSILSHFLIRFLTLVFAFTAWTVSIVIGASISSTLQLALDNNEKEILGTGFELVAASGPVVLILLWAALLVRCAWFLARLRGWTQHPADDRIPDALLASRPDARRVVVALAHPGLLLVSGFASTLVALLFAVYEPLVILLE